VVSVLLYQFKPDNDSQEEQAGLPEPH